MDAASAGCGRRLPCRCSTHAHLARPVGAPFQEKGRDVNRDEAGPDTDVDDFDLAAVIGSGPPGEKGATQAAYYGHRVAVVERRAEPGGAAIEVSGVPVKALRDAAVYLTGWSRRDVYGIGLSLSPDLAMDRLRAHVTDVVTTMTQAVRANLERHGIQLVHGEASRPGAHVWSCVATMARNGS